MKRCLVTGGTGFVGANLVRRLLSDGHEVHLLVRPGYRDWRVKEIGETVACQVIDFGDAEAVRGAVARVHPDWVFHLATHGAYPTQTDVAEIVRTNVVATVNLVEACLRSGFEVFVNTGSSSEYGFKDHAPAENEWLEPNSHYAVTKASAALYCRFTARSRGMRIPTLRLYSVYGPYEEPSRLLPTIIVQGLEGGLPPLASPDIARDYIYVDDVCEAYVRAACVRSEDPGAVYNIGSGVQTTLRDVVSTAQRVLPIRDRPHWGSMANRTWDTSVWVADATRIARELGWHPQLTFAEGFVASVDWFRRNPELLHEYRERQRAALIG